MDRPLRLSELPLPAREGLRIMTTDIDTILAEFKTLSDLDKLALTDPCGNVWARLGFVVTLFLVNGNTPEKRLAFTEVLRNYYATFGDAVTHYQKINAGRLSRIRGTAFLDHYQRNATRPVVDDSKNSDVNSFTPHLYGFPNGEEKDEPPLYYIGGGSLEISAWFPPGTVSNLDAYIPASWVDQNGYPALTELLRRWCNILKPTHGTAGLGTLFDQGSSRANSGLVAFPLIKRFPGLDYNDTEKWLVASEKANTRVIRTTNWLNVLDDGFVAQLGGVDALVQALGPNCPIHPYEGGVIIQAGPHAELGDLNRRIIAEHYRTVARVLKPLRFEAYTRALLNVPDPLDGLEETKAWIARFD
jgi:hypothetical protein